ncbi:hypothetical protein BDL97_19G051500 [Sphagnum fallax]|nr:hypothetical protein BDL97_19G051500 [Sphagnum fallax]
MAWPQGQGWGGGVVLQQAVKPPSSCALGVGEQQADGKRRSLLLLLGGYRNLIEAHKYCCKGYHSAEVYNTHHIQRLKYNSNCAIDSISSNSSSSSFITSQVSRFQQMGDLPEAQDHRDETYGVGQASDGYKPFERAPLSKQLRELGSSTREAASEAASILAEVTQSRNGIRDGDVRTKNNRLQQKPYDTEVAREVTLENHRSEVVVTESNKNPNKVSQRESPPANMLKPQALGLLSKRKRVSNNRRSEAKGNNNKTVEIVRKAVIDVLAHSDNMGDALQRASTALRGDFSLWNQMMKQMECRGARRQALQVFRFLQAQSKFEMREQNYVTIMSILGREGKLGLIKEIFDQMRDAMITPTVHSYSVLISGYTKQGLLKEAWEIFEVMKKDGCEPNIVTYNILIHACAKNGFRLHKVVALFEEMKKQGIQPDDITYNCMVNACLRHGLLDAATQILTEMKAVNCLPNVVTYTAMINYYGKSGKLQEAVALFEEMKELGRAPTSWTYNSLLKAYSIEGCYEQAMGLYGEMEGAGCLPDLYTYNTVIDMCGRGGLFEEAEGVFIEMQSKGCSPDRVTYNTMLDAYSKGGHFVKARQVLDNMKQAGCAPNLWTYNILLDSLGKAGCIDEAAQLYDDLKSAGHSPNLVSFSAMINTYGRWGLFAEAQKLWQEMRAAGCVPDATVFCGLINSYSHHGSIINISRDEKLWHRTRHAELHCSHGCLWASWVIQGS